MVLYRVEGYVHLEECRSFFHEFFVSKETEKGYWVDNGGKWVSKTSKKRYAHPTKKEALDAFAHRKRRQVDILRAQLKQAEKYLEKAQHALAIKK